MPRWSGACACVLYVTRDPLGGMCRVVCMVCLTLPSLFPFPFSFPGSSCAPSPEFPLEEERIIFMSRIPTSYFNFVLFLIIYFPRPLPQKIEDSGAEMPWWRLVVVFWPFNTHAHSPSPYASNVIMTLLYLFCVINVILCMRISFYF